MAQGTMKTVVVTSILGTMRVFVVLLAGFLASKWPKHERAYLTAIIQVVYPCSFSNCFSPQAQNVTTVESV